MSRKGKKRQDSTIQKNLEGTLKINGLSILSKRKRFLDCMYGS